MASPTQRDLVKAFERLPFETEERLKEDAQAIRILELRARGNTSWASICREVGIPRQKAFRIFRKELERRREERAELADAEVEQLLSTWDADISTLNDLIQQALDGVYDGIPDDKGSVDSTARIDVISKLFTQKRAIEQKRIDLLGLDAPERMAVLVADATTGPSMEQLESMSVDELEAQLEKQRKLRMIRGAKIIDAVIEEEHASQTTTALGTGDVDPSRDHPEEKTPGS